MEQKKIKSIRRHHLKPEYNFEYEVNSLGVVAIHYSSAYRIFSIFYTDGTRALIKNTPDVEVNYFTNKEKEDGSKD